MFEYKSIQDPSYDNESDCDTFFKDFSIMFLYNLAVEECFIINYFAPLYVFIYSVNVLIS